MHKHIFACMFLIVWSLLLCQSNAHATTATVVYATPRVVQKLNGAETVLESKMKVPVAATVKSNGTGRCRLMFPDTTTVNLAPDTEITLAEFVENPNEESIILNMAIGTARIITGEVSRRNPSAMIVNTPHASVGIRGTLVTITVAGDTTKVYLTETSGKGVTVTSRYTGETKRLRKPGSVIIVSPKGFTERKGELHEARTMAVDLHRAPRKKDAISHMPASLPRGVKAPQGRYDGSRHPTVTYLTFNGKLLHRNGKPIKVVITPPPGPNPAPTPPNLSTPVASDDTNSISEGAITAATGNVLDNDNFNVDGPAGGVKTVEWAPGQSSVYGTITLNRDGSYSYTLNNSNPYVLALKEDSQPLTETFTYTITDADGDTSPATLTITIDGINHTPTIEDKTPENPDNPDNPVNAGNFTLTLNEANLPGGSDPNNAALTKTGELKLTSGDGFANVKLDGNVVYDSGNGFVGGTYDTDEGTLTVTGFDPATGILSFAFALTGNSTEQNVQGAGDIVNHLIPSSVEDFDGEVANGSVNVVVRDDAPVATDNSDSVTEGSEVPVTGNVLDNDQFNADGPQGGGASVEWAEGQTAQYGTITLNPDGSYSYVLDNSNPDVLALREDSALTETFTYTITDADGDTSEATLTIKIDGINHIPTVEDKDPGADNFTLILNEANLPVGSAPNPDALTRTGELLLTSEDGFKEVKVGDKLVYDSKNVLDADVTVPTDEGTLTVTGFDPATGILTFEYTLEQTTTTGTTSHLIPITVTDLDGDSASENINVVIVKDGVTTFATRSSSPATAQTLLDTFKATSILQQPLELDTVSKYTGVFSGPYINFTVDMNAKIHDASATVKTDVPGGIFKGLDGSGAVQNGGDFKINNFTPDTSLGTTFRDMNVNGQFLSPDHGNHTTTITDGLIFKNDKLPNDITIKEATQSGTFDRVETPKP